ncbi:uncharacterized protein YraI [Bradyrhizobium sp. RT10b]
MLVRVTTNLTASPTSLVDFGMTSGSNPIVTYKKGIEIFGEKKPAEYVYQVRTGAVRATNCLQTVAVRSARFISLAIYLGLKTVMHIGLPRKRL